MSSHLIPNQVQQSEQPHVAGTCQRSFARSTGSIRRPTRRRLHTWDRWLDTTARLQPPTCKAWLGKINARGQRRARRTGFRAQDNPRFPKVAAACCACIKPCSVYRGMRVAEIETYSPSRAHVVLLHPCPTPGRLSTRPASFQPKMCASHVHASSQKIGRGGGLYSHDRAAYAELLAHTEMAESERSTLALWRKPHVMATCPACHSSILPHRWRHISALALPSLPPSTWPCYHMLAQEHAVSHNLYALRD